MCSKEGQGSLEELFFFLIFLLGLACGHDCELTLNSFHFQYEITKVKKLIAIDLQRKDES